MSQLESQIRRLPLAIEADPRRVLLRPFIPSLVVKPCAVEESNERVDHIFARVTVLDEAAVKEKLSEVIAEFGGRHQSVRAIFAQRFEQVRPMLPTDRELSEPRRLLLGSYFTNEYSLESSALFNPSMVPSPDQGGLAAGELRFVLSLRAIGEGHISSVTFRSGVVTEPGDIRLDPVSRYVLQPRARPDERYNLEVFRRKLRELDVEHDAVLACTGDLPEEFVLGDLRAAGCRIRAQTERPAIQHAADTALRLAEANYTVRFDDDVRMSEKALFPHAPGERNGIEDARFVRFAEPGGGWTYYATYTAYDGNVVLPQMVATRDFHEFSLCTLNGPAVRDKGFALFPRQIGGHYAMLGRQDGENIHVMFSDHLHFWHNSRIVLRPREPWEFVQLGNCGSPIEIPEGWLVLTHGVGPMRKYCLGAVLLDRDDPTRVKARLREPLLRPLPDEREGYVPNVVYSCGGLLHGDNLVIPYGVSDTATRFAVAPLHAVLDAMVPVS